MKTLLEAGAHFGHQTRRWNPKMRSFIFTQRNGIHIIDLQQTAVLLAKAYDFVKELVANGGEIIFVGTKKQAQESIQLEAKRCGMHFVDQRWLGGMLTNFTTIQNRIDYLVRLEDRKVRGELDYLPKKEAHSLDEEVLRLNRQLGGVKALTKVPGAIFIVDPSKERIAISEARKIGIPIVSVVDTNCDPDEIDYPIPANDDAIKAIKLITSIMANAVLEGKALRAGTEGEPPKDGEASVPAKDGQQPEKDLAATTNPAPGSQP
ncbi:MAG: 30S ribosomal protein S2 [Chloroflexi bacterium]|nr:30S ribosomal protein S2 [Chloroflexota bacterium]